MRKLRPPRAFWRDGDDFLSPHEPSPAAPPCDCSLCEDRRNNPPPRVFLVEPTAEESSALEKWTYLLTKLAIQKLLFLEVIRRRQREGQQFVPAPVMSRRSYQIAQPGRMLRLLARASLVRGAP